MTNDNLKRLAWDGVSFPVPQNWELALYQRIKRKIWHLEIEDEYSVRLEVEWIVRQKTLDMETVLKRYEQAATSLTRKATQRKVVDAVPKGWTATHYIFQETEGNRGQGLKTVEHGLTTAFYTPPDKKMFCFLLLHTYPESTGSPYDITRTITSGFERHTGPLIPWQLFDISFDLPRDFLLENTQFGIGSKLMIFRWRLRRFYLWHFSCANHILKDGKTMEEWAAGYLNSFRHIKGLRFYPGKNGEIKWKRRRRHMLGHREEIVRLCFRYRIRCHHDHDRNRIVLWLYSYRKEEDLEKIPPELRNM